MESIVARAFKSSSFFSEIAVKSASPLALAAGEECLSAPAAAAGEDFSVVDEYFDIHGLLEEEEEEEEEEENNCSSSLSLNSQEHVDDGSSGAGLSDLFSGADGLAIPIDDMKELELWSNLMDDTVTDDISAVKTGPNAANRVQPEPQTKPATVEAIYSHPPVQTKPRSKRFRTATGSSDFKEKRKKSRSASENGGSVAGPVQQRRCTHCLVQKTPQWRTGPAGPKTLCNACGVRFKSGRLFPEYRPACSPTFSDAVHSNSHRKVLEMREKKMAEVTEPGAVQQF